MSESNNNNNSESDSNKIQDECLRCIKSVKEKHLSITVGRLYSVVQDQYDSKIDSNNVKLWRDDVGYRLVSINKEYFEKFVPRIKKDDLLVCVHGYSNLLTVGVIYQAASDSYFNCNSLVTSEHVFITQDDHLTVRNAFDIFHFEKATALGDENDTTVYFTKSELYRLGINEI